MQNATALTPFSLSILLVLPLAVTFACDAKHTPKGKEAWSPVVRVASEDAVFATGEETFVHVEKRLVGPEECTESSCGPPSCHTPEEALPFVVEAISCDRGVCVEAPSPLSRAAPGTVDILVKSDDEATIHGSIRLRDVNGEVTDSAFEVRFERPRVIAISRWAGRSPNGLRSAALPGMTYEWCSLPRGASALPLTFDERHLVFNVTGQASPGRRAHQDSKLCDTFTTTGAGFAKVDVALGGFVRQERIVVVDPRDVTSVEVVLRDDAASGFLPIEEDPLLAAPNATGIGLSCHQIRTAVARIRTRSGDVAIGPPHAFGVEPANLATSHEIHQTFLSIQGLRNGSGTFHAEMNGVRVDVPLVVRGCEEPRADAGSTDPSADAPDGE